MRKWSTVLFLVVLTLFACVTLLIITNMKPNQPHSASPNTGSLVELFALQGDVATGASGLSPHLVQPQASPLDAVLDSLFAGHIAFNVPDHVRVGRSQIIEAKLAINIPVDILLSQIKAAGEKEVADLKVADVMRATLLGGSAFDVAPSGPQEQPISHQEATTWTWTISGKQVGTQDLVLSVDAVLTLNGKERTRNINTFTKRIKVEVGWPESPNEWFDWLKQWFDNVSWLWVTILLPAGLWLWGRLLKKWSRSSESASAPAESIGPSMQQNSPEQH